MSNFQPDIEELQKRLEVLVLEHRDLDDIIQKLYELPVIDQLQIQRLKKRKLLLKDMIEKLHNQLIPDLDA